MLTEFEKKFWRKLEMFEWLASTEEIATTSIGSVALKFVRERLSILRLNPNNAKAVIFETYVLLELMRAMIIRPTSPTELVAWDLLTDLVVERKGSSLAN